MLVRVGRAFFVLLSEGGVSYFCSMGYMKRQAEAMTNRRSWGKKSNSLGGQTWPIEVSVEGDTGITQRHQREQDKKAVAKFNSQVRGWGKMVNGSLVTSIGQYIDKDVHLSSSLKQNYRHYGKTVRAGEEITSIGFSFAEEGIYVHLGVGRGYAMEGGTRIITKKTNLDDLRKPKDWFNSVIRMHIDSLGEIVKNYCGDLYLNASQIYINR